jgi:hypothetical protein
VSNSFANHRAVAYNPDSDLTFVESGTVNATDLFDYEDAPFSSGTIFAVQSVTTAKRGTDANHDFCPAVKSGATTYQGTTIALPLSYATYLQTYAQDPATSAAWTVSGLNAAEFGYRLLT